MSTSLIRIRRGCIATASFVLLTAAACSSLQSAKPDGGMGGGGANGGGGGASGGASGTGGTICDGGDAPADAHAGDSGSPKKLGDSCGGDLECATQHCIDGVCL
jgi:hypothetical protein